MNQDAKRIKIAEYFSWTNCASYNVESGRSPDGYPPTLNAHKKGTRKTLPDYFGKRDIIINAIASLTPTLRDVYLNWLYIIVNKKQRMATVQWLCITAEASDYAEAFGLTLELWKHQV